MKMNEVIKTDIDNDTRAAMLTMQAALLAPQNKWDLLKDQIIKHLEAVEANAKKG